MWPFPVLSERVKADRKMEIETERRMGRISGGSKREKRKEVMSFWVGTLETLINDFILKDGKDLDTKKIQSK
jgi:hypothetical protein